MLKFFAFNQKWFVFILVLLLVLVGLTSYLMYATLGPTRIVTYAQRRSGLDSSIVPGAFTWAGGDTTGTPTLFFRAKGDKYLYSWSPFSIDPYGVTIKTPQYGNQTAPTVSY